MSEQIPSDLQYTRSHEWVRSLPNGQVEVGITDHAQQALGDLVFVELQARDLNFVADVRRGLVTLKNHFERALVERLASLDVETVFAGGKRRDDLHEFAIHKTNQRETRFFLQGAGFRRGLIFGAAAGSGNGTSMSRNRKGRSAPDEENRRGRYPSEASHATPASGMIRRFDATSRKKETGFGRGRCPTCSSPEHAAWAAPDPSSLCENEEILPPAAKAASILRRLRHG